MNELMTRVFENEEFGQVRTIVENGEVLFCSADVAKALGYAAVGCPVKLITSIGVQ